MMIGRLEQRCIEHGLRISDQRRAILYVLDEAEDHPSVEEIHARAMRHDPRLSIATVYRTINILAERGLLSRLELGDGKARYEDGHGEHHEHLVDVDSGRVVELSEPAINDLLREVAARCGYHLVNYRLELFGASMKESKMIEPAIARFRPSSARWQSRQFPRNGPRMSEGCTSKKTPSLEHEGMAANKPRGVRLSVADRRQQISK